jgi:hypothetical protein
MRIHTTHAALAALALACGASACVAEPDASSLSAPATAALALVPSSDVELASVVGVGDTASLYRDVDDGTTAAAADDSTTYVRGVSGAALASHTVGYGGAPAGTVTAVTVHYRAQRGSTDGTIQVQLLDGATLIGTGPQRALGSWADLADTFTGLAVADANQLRTRVILRNTRTNGAVRYTQIWIEPTLSAPPPPPPPPPTDVQPAFPIRAAFYYPWFPNAWTQGGVFPFTNYHPSDGYYDSGDAAEIRRHIAALQYGGMQAAIASWWGPGHQTDQHLAAVLATTPTASSTFRWAVYHEGEGQGDPTVAQLQSDLVYLRDHYGADPSVLRVNGKFVVFVYAQPTDGCGMADRWKQANTVGAYIVLKVFSGYRTCASQPDSWHQYAPANAADSQAGYSYTISPGFWLKGDAAPRLTRDPARWNQNVLDMKASNAPWQLVTTFNEWGEGTSVESATEWASASTYGTYLDALHAALAP